MHGLQFSPARRDDLPLIVSTYNATVPSRLVTADLEPVSVSDKIGWFESHNTQRPLWIIHLNSAYCGWMSFKSFYGRPAYSGTVEVSIYLEESARGKGIGKACLSHAISAAPALGIHTLLGFIFGHNLPSLQLFKAFGFETWGHLPRVANMDGVERDLLILGRRVD
jgi:L-amino acid N-acyltransferase YncA